MFDRLPARPDPASCSCGDVAALVSAQLAEPDSPPPACAVHRPLPPDDRAPLALNDDAGLAAVLGLALTTDHRNFEGGTVPPAA